MDNSRLGKGLDALFGAGNAQQKHAADTTQPDSSAPGTAMQVPIDAIDRNPRQPREYFGDDSMVSLAESIRDHGIIQPIIVALRPSSGESGPRYTLVAGERRVRAAEMAGLKSVPVVIKSATPQQMLELALIENIQREDLNPIELAHAYTMLVDEYGMSQEEVARRLGRERSTITNQIALLRLPPELQEKLTLGLDTFTQGHAKALIGIQNAEAQVRLMNQIIAQNLSVRQAEEAARGFKEAALRLIDDRKGSRRDSPDIRAIEDEITRSIALKVALKRNSRGSGTLTISFANEEELNTIYELLVMRNQNEEF